MNTADGYSIGWNMPGYMPEMEPYAVQTADDAKTAMIDELERAADQADMAENGDLGNELSALAEDLNLANVSDGWDATVGNLHYWISPLTADEMAEFDNADI